MEQSASLLNLKPDLSKPENAKAFKDMIASLPSVSSPPMIKDGSPKSVFDWFEKNMVGRVFAFDIPGYGHREFKVAPGHIGKLVCKGDGKGIIKKAYEGSWVDAVRRGDIKAEDVAGWDYTRARTLPRIPILLTEFDAVLHETDRGADVFTFVKKFDTKNGRPNTIVMKLVDDGKTIGPITTHIKDLTPTWLSKKDLILTEGGEVYGRSANNSASRTPQAGDNAESNSQASKNSISQSDENVNEKASVRYARNPSGVVRTFMDMDETRAQKTLRRTQDAMNSVKRVEDYYGVKHDDSVYYAEDSRYGKDEHGSNELERKWQKPILDEISKRNVDLGDLDQYLKAKFALQRNAMIRARDSKNDAGSGMTDAAAQAILDAFDNAGKTADLDAVAKKVWALNHHVLDMYVAAGIMSATQANYWKRHSDKYVPLRDAPIDEEMETGAPTGIGKNVTRHAIGRRTEASGSPLAYSFVQAQQAVLRCNKNAVRQKLAAMVQAHPEMGRVLDMQPMKKIYAPGRGKNVWVADKSFNENERNDVVQVKIGGELKFVQLNGIQGELMARAITHKGMAQWPELLHWIPATTKWMAAMRTSYVPTFLLRNSLIDNRQVVTNMAMDGFGKQALKFEANIPSAMRCAYGYFKNGKPTGQLASLFTEYLENGGLIGGAASEGYNEVSDKIKRILKKGVAPRARVKHAMETLSSTGETSTRFAVYAALRQAGVDVGKAISYSRDVTVNFNRKGEWTPIANSIFMFSNAAIQDMERTLRSWTNKEAGRMGRKGAAKRVMAAMVFLGALESLIGHLQDDDDKEKNGDPQYRNMSEWQKQTNWILMFGKKYFHAPVRGLNALLPYLGKKIIDAAFGEDPGQAAKDVLGFTAATSLDFLPAQFLDSENYAVSILNDIAPTILQPVVQLATNKKFTGEDLTNPRFDKNTPKSENGKRSTPGLYKFAAKKLNAISGGNEGRRGALDFAPEELQTSLEAFLGGVLADASHVIGLGLDAFDHDLSVDRTPVVRDVVRNVPDNTSRFWEAVEKHKKLEMEAKALRKRPDKTGIRELIEKHPSARQEQSKTINGLVKTIRELSEAEREATGDRRDKIRARRLKLQARVLELAE